MAQRPRKRVRLSRDHGQTPTVSSAAELASTIAPALETGSDATASQSTYTTPVQKKKCVVCNDRKLLVDFELVRNGSRLPTCNQCMRDNLPSSQAVDDFVEDAYGDQIILSPLISSDLNRHDGPFAAAIRPRRPPTGLYPPHIMTGAENIAPLAATPPATGSKVVKSKQLFGPQKMPPSACCRICAEDKPCSEFVCLITDVPGTCFDHISITTEPTCKECISTYLVTAIDQKNPEKLGCIHENCNEVWKHHYIRKYMTEEQFVRLSDALFKTFLITNQDFVYCPNTKCDSGGIIDIKRPGYPQFECGDCKNRFCALCKTEWHGGVSCQQYRAKNGLDREDRKLSQQLQGQNARRCPHCQMVVIKDGGCNNMFCDHCHREFWWETAERVTGFLRQQPARAATKAYSTSQSITTLLHWQPRNNPFPAFPCEADVPTPRPSPTGPMRPAVLTRVHAQYLPLTDTPEHWPNDVSYDPDM